MSERIQQFEEWLLSREEERIVVVGHSNFFRTMLGIVSGGIDNVSFWQATLSKDRVWEGVKLIHEGCGGADFG